MASYGAFMNSQYFGFQIVCGAATCNGATKPADIRIPTIKLFVQETTGPSISAGTPLYYQSGWIRGTWPLAFTTADVSGVCHIQANVDGQPIEGPTSVAESHDLAPVLSRRDDCARKHGRPSERPDELVTGGDKCGRGEFGADHYLACRQHPSRRLAHRARPEIRGSGTEPR